MKTASATTRPDGRINQAPPAKTGRILHGDALLELTGMATASAQLVIADPPYYQVLLQAWDRQWPDAAAYLSWSLNWMREAMRVLRPDGLLYCFGQLGKQQHTFLHLMSAATREWPFHDLITWDRVVGYRERRDSFTPATELILVLRKSAKPKFNKSLVREPYDPVTIQEYLRDKRYSNRSARRRHLLAGKYATNLWCIPSLKGNSAEKCGHPAQKPIKLIERIVLSSSDPGDLVLDPFLGSCTTAIVARQHGRSWLGIEADSAYVRLARARLKEDGRRKSKS